MSITKQELKKRLVGCQNVGEINVILEAAGYLGDIEINEEIAKIVETAYALIRQGIPLGQAVDYARTGDLPPEPETDMEGLLVQQSASGADFKNQVGAAILEEDVMQSATEYLQVYYPLFAAAVNSEAVLTSPEVSESINMAKKIILGKRVGKTGKSFLNQVILGAASKNLLPQLPTRTAGLLAGQSDKK
ncbi:hypothetical protein VF14_03280 [Nostoc linckia z18]|jgi:hypothetical protein|uniref:Uncharacterized protein n=2 Tax=Nostoc linckia TaxID=92942 RepID=A0A9Q5ZHA5_NOSLI|nr:hypothetical protein [Nostoc linckia]PHK42400.1 hypothetical protein VF12_03295 [Nostoc linckia z15]PHK46908.1 hypothetical protein VF13_07920 [Nostoc linckia z16]PHJ69170.1 hypothetical protein VF02_00750 [Nostoc linckia z1]PHJ73321.1 hypothetical protein VF05_01765 [Nostoc linckia z3]PHJ78668.1 hypothetical protein VF03_00750 [Nostoc linckia z2]